MNIQALFNKKAYKFILVAFLGLFLVTKVDFEAVNQPEFYFKILKFFYWVIVCGTAISLIFFLTKSRFEKHSAKLLFLFILLYVIYWIPYGLDITDTGYSLSNSWIYPKYPIFNFEGTLFFVHLWQHIAIIPYLLWARLGYALVIAGIGVMSYKTINLYLPNSNKIYTFVAVFVSAILSCTTSSFTTNYNNVPLLIITLAFYFLSKAIIYNSTRNYIYSSCFIFLGIFSRFPYILHIITPAILAFQSFLYHRKKSIIKRNLIYTYSSLALASIIAIILLALASRFEYLVNFYKNLPIYPLIKYFTASEIKTSLSNKAINYVQNNLWSIYKEDIWLVFTKSIPMLILIIIPVFIRAKGAARYILIIIFAFLFHYYSLTVDYWYYAILAVILAIIILVLIFRDKFKRRTAILLLMSTIIASISFLGSNNGLQNIIHSGGSILVLSVALILLKETKIQINGVNYDFSISFIILIISVFYVEYSKRESYLYRDTNRKQLTTMCQTPALWGIYSSPDRVQVIDDLVRVFDSLDIKDYEYVSVNKNHILPFITNKSSAIGDWTTDFDYFMEKSANEGNIKYVIMSLKDTRSPDWPNVDSKYQEQEKVNVDRFCEMLPIYYNNIYENKMFAIWKYDYDRDKLFDSTNLWTDKTEWSLPSDDKTTALQYIYETNKHGKYCLSARIKLYPDDSTQHPRVTLLAKYDDETTDIMNYYDVYKDGLFRKYRIFLTTDSTKNLVSVLTWVLDHSPFEGEKHSEVRDITLNYCGRTTDEIEINTNSEL